VESDEEIVPERDGLAVKAENGLKLPRTFS